VVKLMLLSANSECVGVSSGLFRFVQSVPSVSFRLYHFLLILFYMILIYVDTLVSCVEVFYHIFVSLLQSAISFL